MLLTSLALVAAVLPALGAAPASAGTRADGAGFVDHQYGTVTDDVTAHTSQSKVWFHDGAWWAVMMEPAATAPVAHENRWAIYRLDAASQTWSSTKVQVDQRNQSHPDVLAVGNSLYVVSSYSRTAGEAVKVFKFDYQPVEKSYALDPLFVDADPNPLKPGRADDGVETAARGVQFATIARAGNTLLVAYAASNDVWYMTSDLQALSWSAPQPLNTGGQGPIAGEPGVTPSTDDIAVAVGFGGQLGVMWSRSSVAAAPYGGFFFAVWNGSGFGPVETAWDGSMVGDNHISVVAASDGRVLVAVKTGHTGAAEPLVALLARGASGGWSRSTVVTGHVGGVKVDATRPVLALDTTTAHVLMTDRVDGGAVYRNAAPLSSLTFDVGLGTAFIKSTAHPFVNDASTTKQQVDASLGIMAIASDDRDGTDTYLHGCSPGSTCPSGPLTPPPAPAVQTTTKLTSTPNPSISGGPVTLTATVSGGPDVGGSVTFFNGSAQLKTVTLSGGTASTTVTTLSTGTHALKAIYTGSSKYLGSESAVLSHRVNAGAGSGSVGSGSVSSGSTGGGAGGVGAPPPGSRLQVLGTPKTVVTGKGVGKNKVRWVTLPAPAGATGAALTVVARASSRPTTLAVCAANVGKQACAGQKLMTLDRRGQQAKSAVVQLPAPRVMLWNKAGKARVTVMVQGWYVNDATQLKGTALSSAQKVVKAKRLGAGQAYTLTLPAALRPAGTKAVELQVRATKATRNAAAGVCRPAAGKRACLSRPALYGDPGSAAANWVVVRVGKNGKVKLVNGGGSVKLTVHLTAVYLPS